MRVALKVMPVFFWDTTAVREMKLIYISIQVFIYLCLFFYIVTSTFYTCPPVLNKTLYPSLVKVIGLSKPLLNSHDDCIGIREVQAIITQELLSLQQERTLCPCTAVTEEKVNEPILQDWSITTRKLIPTVGINFNTLGTILTKLGYRKLCARWVPHILTQDHKEQRLLACTNLLERYESLGDDFQGFFNANAVIAAVKKWLAQSDDNFYERGIQGLVQHWRICIERGGDYVEK
jgi:hypothetical protein